MARVADHSVENVACALRGAGLWLDVGAAVIRVRTSSQRLAQQIHGLYRHFPFEPAGPWADIHVELRHTDRWTPWNPTQTRLYCDGRRAFDPFPDAASLPLLEWGCNWLIGSRMNQFLLLHAGVLEKDGRAIVLPAVPGSGKSTLSAALSLRGWRLLSDEFGALDPATGLIWPVLKPPSLKNQSIEVIRRFEPTVQMGPEFPNTHKGRVVHLVPQAQAVALRRQPVRPGMVVLPRWQAGSTTQWDVVPEHTLFAELAFNAFNYRLLGSEGFNAVVRMVRECPAHSLVYSELDEALAAIDASWQELPLATETTPHAAATA